MGFQVLVGAEVAARDRRCRGSCGRYRTARENIRLYAAPESMMYLRRSGRVGWAAAGAATLLQIKPIVSLTDGVVENQQHAFATFSKAVEKMVELALEQAHLTVWRSCIPIIRKGAGYEATNGECCARRDLYHQCNARVGERTLARESTGRHHP
jgi:fatty acid-binding protein DegV